MWQEVGSYTNVISAARRAAAFTGVGAADFGRKTGNPHLCQIREGLPTIQSELDGPSARDAISISQYGSRQSRISDRRGQRVGMALDRRGVLGARVQRGAANACGTLDCPS
jgi:hypothetical protein